MIQKKVKKMRKTKLSLALSALLAGGLFTGSAHAVNLTEDGLGDAAVFQYYTAKETAVNNGKWRTFIRVINTSEDAVAAKVRFREAANSREVLDFVVFLSPKDEWVAWVDPNADGNGNPGIRTDDESCLYPEVNSTDQAGEGFFDLDANTRYALFKDRAFGGDYYTDNGDAIYKDGTSPITDEERLHEGYAEVIGIASWLPASQMAQDIEHNSSGIPTNCSRVNREFENFESQGGSFLASVEQGLALAGGTLDPVDYNTVVATEAAEYLLDPVDLPRGVDNVLAANAYIINVNEGLGAGYDPLILANFRQDWSDDLNLANPFEGLVRNVLDASYMIRETVQTDTKPDMDSATPFTQMLVTNTKGASYLEGYWGTDLGFNDQFANQFDSGRAFNQAKYDGTLPIVTTYQADLSDGATTTVSADGQINGAPDGGLDNTNDYAFDANGDGTCSAGEAFSEDNLSTAFVNAVNSGSNFVVEAGTPRCIKTAVVGGHSFATLHTNAAVTLGMTSIATPATYQSPARLAQLGARGDDIAVTGGVDAVSGLLMRDSVINEWAAARDASAKVTEYFTQWVLSFPTKHYYVDLQDDLNLGDDVSPTLEDPNELTNDAFAPFSEEYAFRTVDGVSASCEPYRVTIYNREERQARFTSPAPFENPHLCYEVNVLKFGETFATEGLDSSFGTVVPQGSFPVDADTSTRSDRGWAHLVFTGDGADTGLRSYRDVNMFVDEYYQVPEDIAHYDHYRGLPVTGFMFSVYNTNNTANNHASINDHKYTRDITCVDEDADGGIGQCDDWDWVNLD